MRRTRNSRNIKIIRWSSLLVLLLIGFPERSVDAQIVSWQCTGHPPKCHIAFTSSERSNYKVKFGCSGWQPTTLGGFSFASEFQSRGDSVMLNSEVRSVVSIIYQPTTEDITSQPQITLQPKAILKESIDRLNDKINGTLVGVNAGEDLGWTVAYNKQGKPISEKVYSIGEPKLEAINYFANDGSLKSSVHRDLEKNKEHVTTVNTVPWIEGEKIIGSIQSFVLNDSGKVTFERRFDDKNRLSQIQYFNPKSEPIAKNVYHYDGKGTLKSGEFYIDDKIHSRVNYEYQFDSKGNWTKRKGMFTISNKNDSEIPSETIVREYIYQDEKQN